MKTIKLDDNCGTKFEVQCEIVDDWIITCYSEKRLTTRDRRMIEIYLNVSSQGGFRGAPETDVLENGKFVTRWVFLDPCDVDWS